MRRPSELGLSVLLFAALGAGCEARVLAEVPNATALAEGAPVEAGLAAAPALLAPSPPDAPEPARSTSVGSPSNGRLEGGVLLPAVGPGFRRHPEKTEARSYGTAELVATLQAAAREVAEAFPGGEMVVGELGFVAGGEISGHGSHQAGRDADVMFALLDAEGRPLPGALIPLDPEGRGTDFRDLANPADDLPVMLDVARTWRFIAALLDAEATAPVQRLFIAEHLRELLLRHARASGAPALVVARFEAVTCQPAFPHDDHLHVRVFCSAEDLALGCADVPPLYPWQRDRLAAAGQEPHVVPARRTARARVTTHADTDAWVRAEAAKGALHQDVVEFLERRKRWRRQPHPGREWCR